MTAKDYLQEIQRWDMFIEQKHYEYQTLKKDVNHLRAVDYSRVHTTPTSTSAGFTNCSDRKLDIELELKRDMQLFNTMRHERIQEIQRMDRESYAVLLFKRYVEYKTIACIAVEMNKDPKYMSKLHQDALKAFEHQYAEKLEKANMSWLQMAS